MFYTIKKRGVLTLRGVDLTVWRDVETFTDRDLAHKECSLLQHRCQIEDTYRVVKHLCK